MYLEYLEDIARYLRHQALLVKKTPNVALERKMNGDKEKVLGKLSISILSITGFISSLSKAPFLNYLETFEF